MGEFDTPLTGCNQLNGGLRYTKMFMSGTEVCLLYHACQSVPPILPDAQCGQRGGIEGSLAIETERTKKTAMNIMDVRKERANKQTTQGSQGGKKEEKNVFFLIPWGSWPLPGRSCSLVVSGHCPDCPGLPTWTVVVPGVRI